MIVNITLESPDLMPYKKHATDAGFDLRSNEDYFDIYPNEHRQIGTGLRIEIPNGYYGMVVPRSGLGSMGFALRNTIGIIDSEYRGEIILMATNYGKTPIKINKYDRIAQLLLVPILLPTLNIVQKLNETERNEGGFGHTGHN